MSYRYTYLVLDLVLLGFWLVLFLRRRDTRKEMTIMSLLFAAAGLPADYIYLKDWWHPQFVLSGFRLESIFFGFVLGGVAAIIYEESFRKNIRREKALRPARPNRLLFICLAVAIIFWLSFSIFRLNSLLSTICALGLPTLYIFIERSDLLVDGLMTACLLLLIIVFSYSVVNWITPGWVSDFWYFRNTSQIVISNVPVDDIIWYIFAGLFIGPLYAYWQEGRLVKLPQED